MKCCSPSVAGRRPKGPPYDSTNKQLIARPIPDAVRVGFIWGMLGMCLAMGPFVLLYRMFRRKVQAGGEGY
jgi:hypothetical protein